MNNQAAQTMPTVPQAFFDEFGVNADDRVWDYGRACYAAALSQTAGVADGPLSGKYGDVLRPFVIQMERELHANAGKGDRPGWLKMSPEVALLEIYYHLAKLQKAVKDNNGPGIQEYAADVANMSMMLLDICGGLALIEYAAPAASGVDTSTNEAWAARAQEKIEAMDAALPENDMEQGYYGKIETPREAIYEAACALDNQDVPLENWPVKLIAALARAGFAVVPVELPHDALGRAAIAGVAETGNPKHAWDFLIAATRAA